MLEPQQSIELTVTEDPITGVWTFTLLGHHIEVERTHGFVKIDGTLHHAPLVQGLQNIQALAGKPLAYLTTLLTSTGTPRTHTTPEQHEQPPPPKAPTKTTQSPRRTASLRPHPPTPTQGAHEQTVLPTAHAAAYLGLSPATLETQRTRGGGPPFVKLGRRVGYRKADLDQWLAQRVRRSTSDPGPDTP